MVLDTFELMQGGELLVPHIPSHKVVDLAKAVAPDASFVDIGLRPGEKLHEEMISPEEGRRAVSIRDGKYYVIEPENPQWGYKPIMDAVPVPDGFHCASDKNDIWYDADDLRAVLESGI
jgi:FlaA1/EpsC-like NDP-sugar epimerase